MRLLFAGTPEPAVPTLHAIHQAGHDIAAVVTQPDRPRGRGQASWPSSVAMAATELGLPIVKPEKINEHVEWLKGLEVEAAVIVAYGALIRAEMLGIPRHGWINLHFSLLPAYRGAAPVQHALLHGEEVTGATTFLLDEGMDTGPILGQVTESVRPTDTTGSLLERLANSGAGLMVATLDALSKGEATARPQSSDNLSFAPKIARADARIEWSLAAVNIDRLVRAMSPAPGAWTHYGEAVLGVSEVCVGLSADLAPGELRITKNQVEVGCGIGSVQLVRVKPAGRTEMNAADWARGLRDQRTLT